MPLALFQAKQALEVAKKTEAPEAELLDPPNQFMNDFEAAQEEIRAEEVTPEQGPFESGHVAGNLKKLAEPSPDKPKLSIEDVEASLERATERANRQQ